MNQKFKIFASLRTLGINPKMATFAERKKVQKVVYLLDKVFNLHLNVSYNWYLYGPYSPEVTKIIFDVLEGREIVSKDNAVLSGEDLRKIDELKSFLGKDLDSSDKLELLVSLHYLMQLDESGIESGDIISFLKAKKPYFSDAEISNAMDRLQKLKNQ